jgi:hypothetical protein
MAIFEVRGSELVEVAPTTFGAEGIYERSNIQQLLREQITVLGEDLLVVAEEFGGWVDSLRRIDLLCLDKQANLVVVELKRSDDGGHMELQALRYAAMVSAMTFDQLVETRARQLNPTAPDVDDSRKSILEFLGWEEVYEDQFGLDTRIILAAADFGKELTTAVLWLIDRGIDIRCVRLKPHKLANGPLLVDIQQLIPLPEQRSFKPRLASSARLKGRTVVRGTICVISSGKDCWRTLASGPHFTPTEAPRLITGSPVVSVDRDSDCLM